MSAYLFAALRPSLPLAIQRDEAPAAFGLLSWGYRPSPRQEPHRSCPSLPRVQLRLTGEVFVSFALKQ